MRRLLLVLLTIYVGGASASLGVVFSAVKTNDQSHVYGLANQVTFDLIEENLGNAFNGTVFKVPVDGVYLFTFTGKGKQMSLALNVYVYYDTSEGDEMRVAELDSSHYNVDDTMASTSIILELNVGDQVGLILKAGHLVNWDHSPGTYFTSFNGALLFGSTNAVSAFSAATKQDHAPYYPVSYEYVDTNIGSDFDGTAYVAPVPGLYLFTFTGRGTYYRISLEVNGEERRFVKFYHHQWNSPCYNDNSVSNYALLVLKEGEEVKVVNNEQYLYAGADCSSNEKDKVVEFSGTLLTEFPLQELTTRDDVVAFSAVRSIGMVAVENTTVVFDSVELNIGQAFDGVSTFTAPVSGYYLFMFSIMEMNAMVDLMVNGVARRTIVQVFTDTPYESRRSTTSTSAILLLSENDEVQLKGVNYHTFYFHPRNGTVFSGVLLQKI